MPGSSSVVMKQFYILNVVMVSQIYIWDKIAQSYTHTHTVFLKIQYSMHVGFPGSSAGKELTAMQETLARFLHQEDPLGKGLATHSSILGLPWWLRW